MVLNGDTSVSKSPYDAVFYSDNNRHSSAIPQGKPRKAAAVDNLEDDDPFGLDLNSLLSSLRSDLDLKRREEVRLHKEVAAKMEQSNSSGLDSSRSFGLAVSRLNNSLLLVERDGKQLANNLKVISKLADNISSRVSTLDMAKTRVVECLQLAADMRDLGVSSEGVDAAINGEDFEQAAQHIHRFLTLDKAVFQLREASDKDAGQSLKTSYDVLTAATGRLRDILQRRLSDAVANNDEAGIKRFIRLLPLINEHKIGLEIYAAYISKKIEKIGNDCLAVMRAGGTDDSRRNVLYADSLFLLFEAVAGIIESCQNLLENSFGSDHYLDFIQLLQNEIDKFVDEILKEFGKSRHVDRLARAVERYLRDPDSATEKPDALGLDGIIFEMAQMQSHAEMYSRFLKRRVGDEKRMAGGDDDDLDEEAKVKREKEMKQRKEQREQKIDALLNRSLLGTKMQELLGCYIQLENFYVLESIEKAIAMDQKEADQLYSSVVDDVLFICRKSIKRSFSTTCIDGVCATLNNVCTLLDSCFHDYLHGVIKAGYPSTGYVAEAFQTAQTAYNVLQHGKTAADAGPDAQREQFITAANNARHATELIWELEKGLNAESTKFQRLAAAAVKVEHSLAQFEEVGSKMKNLAERAVLQLSQSAFRPRIRACCDAYIDISHVLNEEQLNTYDATDPWVDTLVSVVDKTAAGFQAALHVENYNALLLAVSSETCKQFERAVLKCPFNRLGGLQIDKEFRKITSYALLSRIIFS
ncbi:unnamed protein product, partial [Mesorhabditis spiculigera]